ncbi:flavin reductase [Streptomyces sp. NPDC002928]|uniref:flavin reductase n=1 Tax=Streptomyces sp. NPDC002928 TaxID=3154440 RepID=UPI0033A8A933
MANLSAGVNVVTTDGPRGRAGITVSAACSVTDTPPTMLVCINQSTYIHDILKANERVCINVLAPEHQEVALAFAGGTPADQRFSVSDDVWDHSIADVPVLKGSAASIVGRITSITARGSHSVMFVEANRVIVGDDNGGGLVYFQRRFHPINAPLSA